MKRIKYLVLLTLPLTLLSNVPNKDVKKANDVSSNVIDTFYNYLMDNYTLSTIMNTPYLDATVTAVMADDIYQNATTPVRHSKFDVILYTSDEQGTYVTKKEYYYTADSNGYTSEQYLKLNNTIGTRDVTNSSGKKILFEGNSNSPFYKLKNKKDSLTSYFDIEQTSDGYTFTMTEEGKVLLTTSFINFFPTISSSYLYSFDSKTHQILLKDLQVTTDPTGKPLNMKFTKIEQDFYGAVSESYLSEFSTLSNNPSLTPITSSLTSEQKTKLQNKLTEVQTGITYGNFTQNVVINTHATDSSTSEVSEFVYNYNNYYDLSSYYGSGNRLYLSSLEMTDSTYGSTFIGLAYDSTYEGYYYLAVSPKQTYYAALEDSVYYDSLTDLIPSLGDISPDLFTYSNDDTNDIYTLDLENQNFNDYNFSLSILESILSTSDPAVRYGLFLDNSSSYEFDFKKFCITIKEDGSLVFSIDYTDMYGLDASFNTTISNANSTDITKTGDENINSCLDILSDL